MQSRPSWKEIIEAKETEERLEREKQLEDGRKAWAKIQEELYKQANEDSFKVKGLTI